MLTRHALSAAVVLAAAFATPPEADAATGDLTYLGCLAYFGDHDCVNPPQEFDTLDAPVGVAVSPDGRSLYLVAAESNGIAHYARAPDGSLSFASCNENHDDHGCTAPLPPHFGLYEIAISPDGGSVYVTSLAFDAISHFIRAPNGSLTFAGCIADQGQTGCTDMPQDSLGGVRGVTVSPDGLSVYAVAEEDDSITHFTRTANGGLVFAGCVAEAGQNGCVDPLQDSLDHAAGVAVSPDGEDVYVTSINDDSITQFSRAPGGSIAQGSCVAEGGSNGCTDPAIDSLDGAEQLAISPDGQSVYVTSAYDRSVTHLNRGANGELGFAGCVASTGLSGCADPPIDALLFARGVAVSPDGQSVYVSSIGDSAINHFARGADGALTFGGCVADAGTAGCVDPPQDALAVASDLALSPDGLNAYVSGTGDDALNIFAREPARGAEPPQDAEPPQTTITKKPKRKVKAKKKRAKVTFGFMSSEPGSTFACRLDKREQKPCTSPLTLNAKKGKHAFAVTATDAAGNADPTPATYKFKVKRKRR